LKHSASALIAAARRDVPRASLESDVLGALGAGTLALAPTFGVKLWVALKHAAVSKAGIATIAFTAATGGYAAGRLQERAAHETPAQVVTTQTLALALTHTPAPTPTVTLASTVTVAAAHAVSDSVPVTVTVAATATATATTTVTPPPPSVSLADEVAAIKRARAALLAKNTSAAIAALDDYERAHPDGVMSEESLALRVRADRLAGDDVGAAEALTKLETRFPESVQLPALRATR
jgi:hypothetical protein